MAKHTLSISEVENLPTHAPVYVINKTKGGERGEVLFTTPNVTGTKEDIVRVPSTFIPICLTDQVVRRQLLDSSAFRTAVTRGTLEIVTEEYAKSILDDEDNTEEIERVAEKLRDSTLRDVQEGLGEKPSGDQHISAPVVTLVELMTDSTDKQVLAQIKSLGDLEQVEYKTLFVRAKELGYAKTCEYLKSKKTD